MKDGTRLFIQLRPNAARPPGYYTAWVRERGGGTLATARVTPTGITFTAYEPHVDDDLADFSQAITACVNDDLDRRGA